MSTPNPPTREQATAQLGAFLVGTFVPVVLLCLHAAASGGLAAHPGTVPLCMLTPMLSAIAVQKAAGRPLRGDNGLGFAWGRSRWWLIAPLGFAAYVATSLLISVLATPALVAGPTAIAAATGHLNTPHDLTVASQLGIAFAMTLLVGPVLNLPIFLGEEVGWRGFMNPRLIALVGRPGLIVGGGIWALWHLPFILLGHNYPTHPWLGMAVWLPICVCMNVILHAVRERSGTIVACALSHGAANQLATLLMGVFINETAFIDVVHGPAGAIGLAVLALPAIAAYRRIGRPSAERANVGRLAAAPSPSHTTAPGRPAARAALRGA